jgi:hypothetical protein
MISGCKNTLGEQLVLIAYSNQPYYFHHLFVSRHTARRMSLKAKPSETSAMSFLHKPNPNELTPSQRRRELIALLAGALRRLHERSALNTRTSSSLENHTNSSESPQNGLEPSADKSVSVSPA